MRLVVVWVLVAARRPPGFRGVARGGWFGWKSQSNEAPKSVEEDSIEACVFSVEALAHPFTTLARWLCETDEELGKCGVARVRRALLGLSLQTKALKGMDGAAHGLSSLGSSAASGASVAERVAAARDVAGRSPSALKTRAAAACRAKAVHEAFEAAELLRRAPRGEARTAGDFSVEVTTAEVGDRYVVTIRWAGDADELLRAVEAPSISVDAWRANSAFWHLATEVRDNLEVPANATVLCVGHGAAGSVAALLAARLGHRAAAVVLGAAPCVSRDAALDAASPGARVTTIALGDDLVVRASRPALRRLRRRLRRFLPSANARAGSALMRLGAAVASSALDQSFGAASRAAASKRPRAHDDDDLALPGDVFYLKPRADATVGIYTLIRGSNRAREELLWQLNDILLSKSMLAHHSLDAYIFSLELV